MTRDVDLPFNNEEIKQRLSERGQYANRTNALKVWEKTAPKQERTTFEAYVRNWLLLRDDGHNIGWKAFSELCCEDIPSFDVAHQALKGALSERIKRL
tara:strand:- start:1850 stop:2143 length:294 start_codon:yes stop_codon:yes gene_type:complete